MDNTQQQIFDIQIQVIHLMRTVDDLNEVLLE